MGNATVTSGGGNVSVASMNKGEANAQGLLISWWAARIPDRLEKRVAEWTEEGGPVVVSQRQAGSSSALALAAPRDTEDLRALVVDLVQFK